MKQNILSTLMVLTFALFIFFAPTKAFGQEFNTQLEPTLVSTNSIKIEDYVNKYLEVKLVNGKKVTGKLVEYKNEKLVLKDGLIKKQISMADVTSFEIVLAPEERFKEGVKQVGDWVIVASPGAVKSIQDVGEWATVIAMIPIVAPIEIVLHGFDLGCIGND